MEFFKGLNQELNSIIKSYSFGVNQINRGAKNVTDELHETVINSINPVFSACGVNLIGGKLQMSDLLWYNFGIGKDPKPQVCMLKDFTKTINARIAKDIELHSDVEGYTAPDFETMLETIKKELSAKDNKKRVSYFKGVYFIVPASKSIQGVLASFFSAHAFSYVRFTLNKRFVERAHEITKTEIVGYPELSYNALFDRRFRDLVHAGAHWNGKEYILKY